MEDVEVAPTPLLKHVQRERDADKLAQRIADELQTNSLDTKRAAMALGLDETTIKRYLRDGRIVAFKAGRSWRIPTAEIVRYKDRQLDAARERLRITEIEEDVKRKQALWSRTKPHECWEIVSCPNCDHAMLAHDSSYTETEGPWSGNRIEAREGTCEVCHEFFREDEYDRAIREQFEFLASYIPRPRVTDTSKLRILALHAQREREFFSHRKSAGEEVYLRACWDCHTPYSVDLPRDSVRQPGFWAEGVPEGKFAGRCSGCGRVYRHDPERLRQEGEVFMQVLF